MNKKSNKLISLLVTFDRDQVKQCKKFLASPYFNRNKDLQLLFDEISKRLDKNHSLEKESIWKSIWGKKPYDDVRFRKFNSDLLKLVENFAIQDELEKTPTTKLKLWLASMNRLRGKKQVEGILRNWPKTIEKINQELPESSDKYLTLFEFEKKRYIIENFDAKTEQRSNIEDILTNLDIFYMSEKLYIYNSTRSTYFSRSHEYKIEFIENIINNIKEHPTYLKYPSIAMQYYTYLLEKEPENTQNYLAFKDLLFNQSEGIKKENLQTHYYTAFNFNIRKINAGGTEYLREYVEVYKDGLSKEAIFENGHIPPQQFKNIVLIALRSGDYEWTKKYIDNYKSYIPEEYRENAVNYNLATFHFYQKDYDKAMNYLRDVEYENYTYNLSAKSMLIAIYYETDEFDALDSLFDAFLAYLSRHKEIPSNYKKLFRNLVSVTRKMTRIIPGDKKAIEKLRKEVEETKAIASLNWVLEKLNELN